MVMTSTLMPWLRETGLYITVCSQLVSIYLAQDGLHAGRCHACRTTLKAGEIINSSKTSTYHQLVHQITLNHHRCFKFAISLARAFNKYLCAHTYLGRPERDSRLALYTQQQQSSKRHFNLPQWLQTDSKAIFKKRLRAFLVTRTQHMVLSSFGDYEKKDSLFYTKVQANRDLLRQGSVKVI